MQPNQIPIRFAVAFIAFSLAGGWLMPQPAVSKWGLKMPSLPFRGEKPPAVPPQMKNQQDELEPDSDDSAPPKPLALPKAAPKDEEEPEAESDMKGNAEYDDDTRVSNQQPPDEPPLDIIDSDPELHYKLAKQLAAKKKFSEALREINKCLELNKDYWDARYLGAYIYQLQDRVPEAIVRYKDYIGHKPDDLQAHINLGVMLRKAGKIPESEEQYRKAIDIKFYSLEAHYNLANLLIAEERYEDALRELRVCLKIAPSNAWVHNNLGVIYHKRNYLEEAADEFLRALNLEPANKTFEQNLTMVRQQMKKKPVKASIT